MYTHGKLDLAYYFSLGNAEIESQNILWRVPGLTEICTNQRLLNMEAKPATIYANPKTHKDGWPLRHIISCCGTAIENVAKWLEIHLRHLAKIHPTYTEDTRHFLEKIEALNGNMHHYHHRNY